METNLSGYPHCDSCGDAILNEYLMQVDDRFWHEKCLKCSVCDVTLTSQCYVRDRNLLCKEDYNRKKICFTCEKTISPSEYIQKAKFLGDVVVYHMTCFACSVCHQVLGPGNEFMMTDEGDLLCTDDNCLQESAEEQENEEEISNLDPIGQSDHVTEFDLLSEIDPAESSFKDRPSPGFEYYPCRHIDNISPPDSEMFKLSAAQAACSSTDQDHDACGVKNSGVHEKPKTPSHEVRAGKPKGKRRGPRTTIKPSQLEALKAAFQTSQKPTKSTREKLSKETGLEMRVIQVWFQNRRSKERRVNQAGKLNQNQTFFDGNLVPKFRGHSDYTFYKPNYQEQYSCPHAYSSGGQYSPSDFLSNTTWHQDHLNSTLTNHLSLRPECALSKPYINQCVVNSAMRSGKNADNFVSSIPSRSQECNLESCFSRINHADRVTFNPLYHRIAESDSLLVWNQ